MGRERTLKLIVSQQITAQPRHTAAEVPHSRMLIIRGRRQVEAILMRAQVAFPDQFGHGYLGVDRAAQFVVPLPLGRVHIVWRRGRQGNDGRTGQGGLDVHQALPPLAAQVVGLIHNDRPDLRLLECRCQLPGGGVRTSMPRLTGRRGLFQIGVLRFLPTARAGAVQSLVRRDCQKPRPGDVA